MSGIGQPIQPDGGQSADAARQQPADTVGAAQPEAAAAPAAAAAQSTPPAANAAAAGPPQQQQLNTNLVQHAQALEAQVRQLQAQVSAQPPRVRDLKLPEPRPYRGT